MTLGPSTLLLYEPSKARSARLTTVARRILNIEKVAFEFTITINWSLFYLIHIEVVENSKQTMDILTWSLGQYSKHVIAPLSDIPMFYIKYLTMHKVHMHAGAIMQLLYVCAYAREIIHSLKLVDYPPVHTHIPACMHIQ